MNSDLKELKEVVVFGFDLVEIIPVLGKKDYFALIARLGPLFESAKAAIDNIGNPIARFRNLSAEARLELAQLAKERFDIPDDELEQLIEDSIDAVVVVVGVASRWAHRAKSKDEPLPEEA
jgi:hypothetical protein